MTSHAWRLVNPTVQSDAYTFPHNPKTQTSPLPKRTITVAQTNVLRGQAILQEGLTPPTQWSFTGTLLDRQSYLDLQYWCNRPMRLWLYDDLSQRLTIRITGLEPTRQAGKQNQWRQDYTLQALVFLVEQL
ncbi:MAG: hypothetical protein ACXVYY_00865 [Oryzihumus sp.]